MGGTTPSDWCHKNNWVDLLSIKRNGNMFFFGGGASEKKGNKLLLSKATLGFDDRISNNLGI